MPKAPRLTRSRQRFMLNPIAAIKERYHKQRQRRLRRKKAQERAKRAMEEQAEECRIHPIYLAYTPEDIAVMTDRDLLNHLFDLYTPMSQSFWDDEVDYLFRMMCAICRRMDELESYCS